MASKKEYKDYVLEQLNILDNIACKPMMGEYLLYYNGLLFGGIYDNRLLVKKCTNNEKYGLSEEFPYDGARPMYYVIDIDNQEYLKAIIIDTYNGLK